MLIFVLSSVLSGREGWHYVLIFGLSSVLSGREDSKNKFILCFQAGKVSITC